jgi:antirestriction protein ArdC
VVIQQLNSIIGKEITRQELVELENSARKQKFIILAYNLRNLLLSDPNAQKFVINDVSEANYIDEQTLQGFELDQDPEPSNLGASQSENIYSTITKMVIDLIEKSEGTLIWEKPWDGAKTYGHLMNYITKKSYRGINYFLLELLYPLAYGKQWENPYFLSKKQIQSKRGTLKKGSIGYPIIFYTFGFSYENKQTGVEILEYSEQKFIAKLKKFRSRIPELKNPKMTFSLFASVNKFASVKRYKVYNGQDIEGIAWKLPQAKIQNNFSPIETAELIIENMPKRPLIKKGGDKAFYSPDRDFVNMPVASSFKKVQSYYSTLFHELIHSTGHKSRLDRSMKGSFGSMEYAYEELIAELGAAYITAEAGILNHHIKNTAAYIKGWNKRLVEKMSDDKTFIFKASGSAQHAADFILATNKKGVPKYRSNLNNEVANAPTKKHENSDRDSLTKSTKPKKNRDSFKPEKSTPKVNKKGQFELFGLGSLPPLFHRPGEKIEKINVFRLGGEMGKALQDLQRYRLVILLTGDTHAGKTQFAWQLVDSFVDANYKVGVFDLEQGGLQSKDTALSIERNVQPKNKAVLAVTGEAPKGIDTIREHANHFDVIMIDSWQKLKLPNTRLDDLRNEFPNTIFIIIFQQNGEGGTRGGVSADFDAPIAIKVHKVDTTFKNNYAEVWKNRGNTAGVKYNWFKKKVIIDKPAQGPEKK